MNDTLRGTARIGAELGAVKAECEELRGLLRMATDRWESWASEIIHTTPEYESELVEIARVRAALSQQAEPAPINQCDGCQAGVPVDEKGYHRMGKPGEYADLMYCERKRYVSEPAQAQDERGVYLVVDPTDNYHICYVVECRDEAERLAGGMLEVFARPAQTEQQPDGWVVIGPDGEWSDVQSSEPHARHLKLEMDRELPPTHEGPAHRIAPVFIGAAPIAQTEQPEQSGLPEELFDGHAVYQEMVRQRRESGLLVRTSPENVSDTLDAVGKLIKLRHAATQGSSKP